MELRRRGAPPPAPPRSFLTERGELRCLGEKARTGARQGPLSPAEREKGENSNPLRQAAHGVGGCPSPGPSPFVPHGEGRTSVTRRKSSNWHPAGPPLPRGAGERGKFNPASTGCALRRQGPSPARSGSHPPPSRSGGCVSRHPPPRSLRGRAGEGGAGRSHKTVRSTPPSAPHPTSPSSFGGGGRVMRARRGRPPLAPNLRRAAYSSAGRKSTSRAWTVVRPL
jgi:hypothetical protein